MDQNSIAEIYKTNNEVSNSTAVEFFARFNNSDCSRPWPHILYTMSMNLLHSVKTQLNLYNPPDIYINMT